PLFKKQIKSGGPVTVTDPKVIRYFMTISEATELVIQAGSLSKGGDVFLLEMGEPIGILDLAKEMIHLSGKEIKDDDNLLGDIEIKYTGLRDGEKLYEELLIGDNVSKTIHDHIMSANEEKLSHEKIQYFIDKIKGLNSKSSLSEIQAILFEAVSGYKPFKASNVININK
ncbi:MAG: polysaccharide biosynthesis protein, partial [Gammaproteobacteria bacterium]|nr:polysaccharide biosynthesis protein [Gammaproteobacteria bacterium]